MNKEIIAEIRLAPGEVGYYDDYSRIYLNSSRPTAKIYAGMNTTQIRRSIRSGRLRLVSGSLAAPAAKPEEKKAPVAPAKPVEEKPAEVKVEEPVIEEPAPIAEPIEEVPAEPEAPIVPEEMPEETAEEPAAKPKRRSRKKQAAEAE